MFKPLTLVPLVTAVLFLQPGVNACGDKMLAIGRGVRFLQAYKSPHPASILIYLRAGSLVQQADKKILLQSTLASVGHHVQVVQDSTSVEQALKLDKYDLVLADPADASSLEGEAQESPSKPLVVPVLYKPSKAEDSSVHSRYLWVLKAPCNAGQLLVTIDSAIESKLQKAERSVAHKM